MTASVEGPRSGSEKKQLEAHATHYKVADLTIPAGQHAIRIHASQKLAAVGGNPRRYTFVMYVPS